MVKSANEIWGDWNTAGVPASGVKKPLKSDIREWGSFIEIFTSASGSALVYQTRTALYADLLHTANQMAWVVADSTVAYNGIYQKAGTSGAGSWSKVAELPIEVLLATNAGAGTANAIQVTTQYPLVTGRLIIVPILLANTSTTVTLAVNGASALPIKTTTGANPSVGGLVPSTVVMYYDGTKFGLLSDLSSAVVTTALSAHEAQTNNPHSVTKAQVGLGNVDNTTDLNKPISTATQTALAAKVTIGGSIGSGATVPTPVSADASTKVANTEWVRDYLTSISSGVVSFNGRTGTVVPVADDYPIALLRFGAWTDVASASTVNLGAQASRNLVITGTTTITSFGTAGAADNVPYLVRFAGALTLTHGASLILPGAANITTAAGDIATVVHDSDTVWRVVDYSAAAVAPAGLALAIWAAGVSLTPAPIDPATLAAVMAAKAPKPGGFSTLLRFGSSGSWTVPEGVTEIWAMLVGGGGGGGNYGGATGTGGAGGIAIGRATVTPGQVIPYVIGAGANNAGTGGTSTFLTLTATGGAGGSGGKGATGWGYGDIVFGDYQRWNNGADHPVRGLLDRLYPAQAIQIAVETAGVVRPAATGSAATAWYPGYTYQAGTFGISSTVNGAYTGSVGGALWIFY